MPEVEFEEQHPIPQDIGSYEFKLVGDMTLKQFLQVAGGILIAFLLYASPLHPAIKWPLALISAALGAALAFLPIEDRPLATWILVFFRSVYTPTIFVWKRLDKYQFFKEEAVTPPPPVVLTPEQKAVGQEVAEKLSGTVYLSQAESKAMTTLETKEQTFLQKIAHMFTLPSISKASIRSQAQLPQKEAVAAKIPEPITVTVAAPGLKPGYTMPVSPIAGDQDEIIEDISTFIAPTITQPSKTQAKMADFSDTASAPSPPVKENVVVGQVLSPDGKIVEGAILEIKDETGNSVRALKTNKLGHFMIVTPLLPGRYEIITEKDGFEFEPVSFNAENKIISPITIKATKVVGQHEEVFIN